MMTEKIQIPLLDLVGQYHSLKDEIDHSIFKVLESGQFILGDEVSSFEIEITEYLGSRYGVGVASGTDALVMALKALHIGPGDEVIIPAYTFFATVGAVLHTGAKPVFVDIHLNSYCLDTEQVRAKITPATKAIIVVHLYGHPVNMDEINDIARSNGIKIIEDNAQAFGAEYHGKKTGSIGDIGCLSFFPSKNLGGYGDGGMVVTNDDELAEPVRRLRTHGWKKKYFPERLGYNSRLDSIQASILRVKLRYLDQWNNRRREIAEYYRQTLKSLDNIALPSEAPNTNHVYHLYIIRVSKREEWRNELKLSGIASGVYYPQPLHLTQPCEEFGYKAGDFPNAELACDSTLAIPLYPELSDIQIEYLMENIARISTKLG